MVTDRPGIAVGVSTADCGPVLFADAEGARHRRRPCRLEGRAHRRAGNTRSRRWKASAPSRERIVAVLGPSICADDLRSRAGIRRPLCRGRRRQRALLPPSGAKPAMPCSTSTAISVDRLQAGRRRRRERGSTAAPMPTRTRFYSYRRATHRERAGLRPPDLRNRPGERLMALHFERDGIRRAPRPAAGSRWRDEKLDAMLLFAQESMYWLTGYDTFGFCFFQCLVLKARRARWCCSPARPICARRAIPRSSTNIVVWTDRDRRRPGARSAQSAERPRPARRAHRRRIRHARPDRRNGRALDEQLADLRQIDDASGHRPPAARCSRARPRSPMSDKRRSACRRRARRRAAADQAGRRRRRDPCRHAGRDLCRRRRLSGQRVHHRLGRRTRCSAATRRAGASSTKNDQLTLEWAGVFHTTMRR